MDHNDTFPMKEQSGQITYNIICRLQVQNADICPRGHSVVNQHRKMN